MPFAQCFGQSLLVEHLLFAAPRKISFLFSGAFNTPHRRLLRTPEGEAYAVEVGRYFERTNGRIERRIFSAAPVEVKAGLAPFEVPTFHRPLSDWISAILSAGLAIEQLAEPRADDATARAFPHIQDTQVVSYFLHLRCRKPV